MRHRAFEDISPVFGDITQRLSIAPQEQDRCGITRPTFSPLSAMSHGDQSRIGIEVVFRAGVDDHRALRRADEGPKAFTRLESWGRQAGAPYAL